jgi:DNA-binding NarL/FixJ family response regulator
MSRISLPGAYILSPHPFVLRELGRWLARRGVSFETVRLPYTLAPALKPLAKRDYVCVVDACFPPATTESLVSSMVEASPEPRILAMADELGDALAFGLLRRGVKGLLAYSEAHRQLLPALAAIARGGCWVPRGVLSRFLDSLQPKSHVPSPAGPSGLSRREHEILDALLQNLSNKEIGGRLNISERTVKFHVSKLLFKFSVQRRADLILLALQPRSASLS